MQKEGSKQVEEEIAFVQRQIWEQFHGSSKDSNIEDFKIKIRWKTQEDDPTNGGYNYDNLHRIFSKVTIILQFQNYTNFQVFLLSIFLQYGDVAALVVSSTKKGRAMVEFGDKSAAVSKMFYSGTIVI